MRSHFSTTRRGLNKSGNTVKPLLFRRFSWYALLILFLLFLAAWRKSSSTGGWIQWPSEGGSADPGTCYGQPITLRLEGDGEDEELIKRFLKYVKASDRQYVILFARHIRRFLAPWTPVQGNKRFGGVSLESLAYVASESTFMACCGHVRILNGSLFYRYGGFYQQSYRLHRFMQSLRMIEDAIDAYRMKDLTVEFLINACDHPLSFFSSHWKGRAGFPVMSTFVHEDNMDIPIPDALDLTSSYNPDMSGQVPWKNKKPMAVFRGSTTSYDMGDDSYNYGANPRLRLHMMSPLYPDLLDCGINRWSHISFPLRDRLRKEENIHLLQGMNFNGYNAYKYQVVVDGGGGSSRVCGVLRSNQLIIRQETPLKQFFEPMMNEYVHMLPTKRSFQDLAEKVRWAQAHDKESQSMVRNANDLAKRVCTVSGRTLYWAVLLAHYARVLENPETIHPPRQHQVCRKGPLLATPEGDYPNPVCSDPEGVAHQPPCVHYCKSKDLMEEENFVWLTADTLQAVQRVGPP